MTGKVLGEKRCLLLVVTFQRLIGQSRWQEMHFWHALMSGNRDTIRLWIEAKEAKEYRLLICGQRTKSRGHNSTPAHTLQNQGVLVMFHSVHGFLLETGGIPQVFLGPNFDFSCFFSLRPLCSQIRYYFTHQRIPLSVCMERKAIRMPPIGMTFNRIIL